MSDSTYNGWTNYATWRVHLEVLDGLDPFDMWPDLDPLELPDTLAAYVEDTLFTDSGKPTLIEDYARAFIAHVNWHEIAKFMISERVEA